MGRLGAGRHGFLHLRAGAGAGAARPAAALRHGRRPGNIGFYGGVLFAVFLVGWGFAFLWGPLADRFGRVRTLVLTILCYSLFTFLGAWRRTSGNWRCSACWPAPGSAASGRSAASSWPRSGRNRAASRAPPGCTPATTSASSWPRIVNYTVGARYGWRAVFAVGGAPALLVAFIRYGVREPERWQQRVAASNAHGPRAQAFVALFSPEYRPPHDRAMRRCCSSRWWGCGPGRSMCRRRCTYLAIARGSHGRQAGAPRLLRPPCCSRPAPSWDACCCRGWPSGSDAAARSRFYFVLMFVFISHRLRIRVLSRRTPGVVHGLPVLPRRRRREFRRLHAVAAGAVPHRMPRQRLRVRHLVRPLPRRRRHVPGGRRSGADAHHRNARGADLDRVSRRASLLLPWRRRRAARSFPA